MTIDMLFFMPDWRFDSLRITPRSLDILARGSPVCGDLAVSLSQSGLQFTQVLDSSYLETFLVRNLQMTLSITFLLPCLRYWEEYMQSKHFGFLLLYLPWKMSFCDQEIILDAPQPHICSIGSGSWDMHVSGVYS